MVLTLVATVLLVGPLALDSVVGWPPGTQPLTSRTQPRRAEIELLENAGSLRLTDAPEPETSQHTAPEDDLVVRLQASAEAIHGVDECTALGNCTTFVEDDVVQLDLRKRRVPAFQCPPGTRGLCSWGGNRVSSMFGVWVPVVPARPDSSDTMPFMASHLGDFRSGDRMVYSAEYKPLKWTPQPGESRWATAADLRDRWAGLGTAIAFVDGEVVPRDWFVCSELWPEYLEFSFEMRLWFAPGWHRLVLFFHGAFRNSTSRFTLYDTLLFEVVERETPGATRDHLCARTAPRATRAWSETTARWTTAPEQQRANWSPVIRDGAVAYEDMAHVTCCSAFGDVRFHSSVPPRGCRRRHVLNALDPGGGVPRWPVRADAGMYDETQCRCVVRRDVYVFVGDRQDRISHFVMETLVKKRPQHLAIDYIRHNFIRP